MNEMTAAVCAVALVPCNDGFPANKLEAVGGAVTPVEVGNDVVLLPGGGGWDAVVELVAGAPERAVVAVAAAPYGALDRGGHVGDGDRLVVFGLRAMGACSFLH